MVTALTQAYLDYLRSRDAGRQTLIHSLAEAGYALEASLLRHAVPGSLVATRIDVPCAWEGHRVFVGGSPPAQAAVGDIWFDILEVVPMILIPDAPLEPDVNYSAEFLTRFDPFYAWLALRPVANWQFGAFLALAPIAPRVVQVDPPFRLLDRSRILRGAAADPVTHLTAGEARMYAGWFGKSSAWQYAWQLAARHLPVAEYAALWGGVAREWAGTFAEGVELVVSPESLARDPQDEYDSDEQPAADLRMLYGEWARVADIGFRTSVSRQTGLFSSAFTDPTSFDNLEVTAILKRSL